jgi:outer membrane protein OmpA-like peptidoglycan-associated protein
MNNSQGTYLGTRYKLNDTEGNMGYQGIIGAAYNFGQGLAMTLEGRYMGTLSDTFGIARTPYAPNPAHLPNSFSPQNGNWSLLVGFRYAFNHPEPAPIIPAAVAPAAARTYLVFFDWNRADLTERARQIIAEAAAAAKSTNTTRIEVAGHADRSGSPQYNQRLSERRAEVVAAELVRRGVPRNEIGISAYGESRPLVPTADGVREPQNRRVEIVLR